MVQRDATDTPQAIFAVKIAVPKGASGNAADLLAARTGLSKSRIKDAMNKGAVWKENRAGASSRLRKATSLLSHGGNLELYYDEKVLALEPPEATLISDLRHYSVWFKPAGLMSQGTRYGDHCSLLRQVELFFTPRRKVFLVHRLDREASGPLLIAHSSDAAARLSALFQKDLIIKKYRVEVLGNMAAIKVHGTIEFLLDNKKAVTEFTAESYDPETQTSVVSVIIRTGRGHQIRRHLDMAGFPVMGDPRYGKGNKNTEGMKLSAVSLRFRCPFQNKEVEFISPY